MSKQKLPPGLTEAKIREIIDHYENQTEEEAVAEDEAAFADPRFAMMQVPMELVEDVRNLIARNGSRSPKTRAKAPATTVAESRKRYGN